MQVSEAFREAGIEPVPTEGDFRLKCDECDAMQRLLNMERSDVAGVTNIIGNTSPLFRPMR